MTTNGSKMACMVCGRRSTIVKWSPVYEALACWDCMMKVKGQYKALRAVTNLMHADPANFHKDNLKDAPNP